MVSHLLLFFTALASATAPELKVSSFFYLSKAVSAENEYNSNTFLPYNFVCAQQSRQGQKE